MKRIKYFRPLEPYSRVRRKPYQPLGRRQWSFNMDSDKDGVPDFRDCQPFNPKRHFMGPAELSGDLEDIYDQVSENAFKRYPSQQMIPNVIATGIVRFTEKPETIKAHDTKQLLTEKFMSNLSPVTPVGFNVTPNVRWYNQKKRILEVHDGTMDVYHYVLFTGKKKPADPGEPFRFLSITGIDRERLGQKDFDKLLYKISEDAKEEAKLITSKLNELENTFNKIFGGMKL